MALAVQLWRVVIDRRARPAASTSDWMGTERKRGISDQPTVLQL